MCNFGRMKSCRSVDHKCGFSSRPSQARTILTKVALQEATDSNHKLDVLKLWPKIVDAYAVCRLTNMDDALPALSSLAKQFQALVSDIYLVGLRLAKIPLSLLWQSRGVRASPYRVPTWSWAWIDTSTQGLVQIQNCGKKSNRKEIWKYLAV